MKKSWLALISDNNLIVARVAVGRNKVMKVTFLSEYKVSAESRQSGEVTNQELAHLKNWFQDQRIPLKKLKITVSSLGLITRVINLPRMSNDDLEKLIFLNANQYFTINIHNYIIDYRILVNYRENEKQMFKVLLAAFPKERMQKIWSFCQYLGFEPNVIDLTADCLTRIFSQLIDNNQIDNNQIKSQTICSPESTQSASGSGNVAIISLQAKQIEFLLLEDAIFFLYSDMEFDMEATADYYYQNIEDTQETAVNQKKLTKEHFEQLEREKHPKEQQLESFQERDRFLNKLIEPGEELGHDQEKELPIVLSESLRIADSSMRSLVEKPKKEIIKEFVLEDLFVPLEELDKDLTFTLSNQELETKINTELNQQTSERKNVFEALDLNKTMRAQEEAKNYRTDKDPKEKLANYLNPVLTSFAELLSFFAASHSGHSVSAVYLVGEYCTLPFLAEILQDNFGVQTIIGFPDGWKPKFKGNSKIMANNWQKYADLYGLALRED
jgi:Tfp pilus assembly PilM family ATPase